MMQISPTLALQRLVVLKSGGALYDRTFHAGLNIIRGENSSGKSTIADFIFFSLGGELRNWTPEASGTDSVHAQVAINGTTYTLSRDVHNKPRIPMHLFEGTYDQAMSARDKWLRYPYSRTNNSESFSQVVFNLLGLPEQKTEAQQNITLHQLLRLQYLDQITSVEAVFRDEQVDYRDIRTAVGELLLGIDDLEMHDIRLRLRETERQFAEIAGELRSMFRVLGQTDHANISVVNYREQISKAETEQRELQQAVDDLSVDRTREVTAEADETTNDIYAALRQTKQELAQQRRTEQALAFDLEDSLNFIRTLVERLNSLSASEHMLSILGNVQFEVCPACFEATGPVETDSICHLCKTPISDSYPWAGHLKMKEELTFQLRESRSLIETRETQIGSIRTSLANLTRDKRTYEAQLASFQRSVHTVDAEIEIRAQRIGYLDRMIEDLNSRAQLAELIARRVARKDELNREVLELKNELESHSAARERRTQMVKSRISYLCVDVLRNDLPLEETFQSAEVVAFDFGSNKMWANERSRFSASSMTLLKNALIFSFFRLSLEDRQVRWPRFLLLDNIEDKGMQPMRSANFQELVEERLANVDIDHQVIMTTSMISPKLDDSPYCVGPLYTHDNKTLSFKERQ